MNKNELSNINLSAYSKTRNFLKIVPAITSTVLSDTSSNNCILYKGLKEVHQKLLNLCINPDPVEKRIAVLIDFSGSMKDNNTQEDSSYTQTLKLIHEICTTGVTVELPNKIINDIELYLPDIFLFNDVLQLALYNKVEFPRQTTNDIQAIHYVIKELGYRYLIVISDGEGVGKGTTEDISYEAYDTETNTLKEKTFNRFNYEIAGEENYTQNNFLTDLKEIEPTIYMLYLGKYKNSPMDIGVSLEEINNLLALIKNIHRLRQSMITLKERAEYETLINTLNEKIKTNTMNLNEISEILSICRKYAIFFKFINNKGTLFQGTKGKKGATSLEENNQNTKEFCTRLAGHLAVMISAMEAKIGQTTPQNNLFLTHLKRFNNG